MAKKIEERLGDWGKDTLVVDKRARNVTAAAPALTTDTAVTVEPSGRWRGVLGFMDEWSADQRMLATPEDGVRSRPLPLPLLVQGTLAKGHDGSELGVGVIDRIWTEGNAVWGEGRFDMEDPVGRELARKVGLGFIRFVSLDVDDATAHQVLLKEDGTIVPDGNPNDRSLMVGDVYDGWRVMGATLLAHPAFPNAAIALADDSGQALTAAAFADAVGYDPAWGCVKQDGEGGWVAADCEDPDAAPAGPDGLPFDPEQPPAPAEEPAPAAAVEEDEEDEEGDAPAEAEGDVEPVEEQVPEDVAADAQEAAEELDPEAEGGTCVAPTEDGGWAPAPCDAPGAVPANADGTGPAEQDTEAALAVEDTETETEVEAALAAEADQAESAPPADCEPCQAVAITAAATDTYAPGWTPPGEWFDPPTGGGAHSIRVDVETGQISGYLAAWGTCHVGYKDRCVPPPRSASGYAYYNLRPVRTSTGTVHCGLITMNTGHAKLTAAAPAAMAHYDHTGTQAAVVRVGEDAHGIWVAGAVLPFLTKDDRLRLSLSSFSGDWREVRGGAELIAALAVNSPGFPLAAKKTGADGQFFSLVAAGFFPDTEPEVTSIHADGVTLAASTTEQFELRPADAPGLASAVADELETRAARRARAASLEDRMGAFRQQAATRRAAELARRTALAKSRIRGLQPQRKTEPPMELAGLGALPNPSTHDIALAKNWVDQQGGLPPFIKRIAEHLESKGMDTSRAIATGVNAAKKMCSNPDGLNWPGIQKVNPGSKAEACAAVTRWEEMKAAAKAS